MNAVIVILVIMIIANLVLLPSYYMTTSTMGLSTHISTPTATLPMIKIKPTHIRKHRMIRHARFLILTTPSTGVQIIGLHGDEITDTFSWGEIGSLGFGRGVYVECLFGDEYLIAVIVIAAAVIVVVMVIVVIVIIGTGDVVVIVVVVAVVFSIVSSKRVHVIVKGSSPCHGLKRRRGHIETSSNYSRSGHVGRHHLSEYGNVSIFFVSIVRYEGIV